MLTEVTSNDFRGLVNPYTGEPMRVFMVTGGDGPVKFTCPDTFSTSDPAETSEALYAGWNRVNGVSGLKSGQLIKCAYTGELLGCATRFGKPRYTGGFDPHLFYSRDEFLYYAWMRDGVSKFPEPRGEDQRVKTPGRTGEVTERHKAHVDAQAPELDEEKIHMIEDSMKPFKDSLERSSTVSMAETGKRGKRGR